MLVSVDDVEIFKEGNMAWHAKPTWYAMGQKNPVMQTVGQNDRVGNPAV